MHSQNQEIPPRVVGFAEGIDDKAVADAFAKMQNLPQFKIVRKFPIKSLFKLKPLLNSKILDFGCGTGHFLIDLYKKASKKEYEFKLYGLDIAQSMLDQCNQVLKQKKVPNVELILEDSDVIPVKDDFFDIVTTNFSLHHWENPSQIFTEIYRVIKPGGHLILFDFRRTAPNRWYRLLTFATKRIVPKALRKANEPIGSLLASYTENEILNFVSKSEWGQKSYDMHEKGAFILVIFSK